MSKTAEYLNLTCLIYNCRLIPYIVEKYSGDLNTKLQFGVQNGRHLVFETLENRAIGQPVSFKYHSKSGLAQYLDPHCIIEVHMVQLFGKIQLNLFPL